MNVYRLCLAAMASGAALWLAGCSTPRPAELTVTQREPYVDTGSAVPQTAGDAQQPAARVVEMRGEEGELAKISLGTARGAKPGLAVEFYVFADYSDLVPNAKREPSPVGYGVITEGDSDFSWVQVTDPEKFLIRRGHYARITLDPPKGLIDKAKGLFTSKKKKDKPTGKDKAKE